MKARMIPNYEVKCPNSYGPNSEDRCEVINRYVLLKHCKKCKHHRRIDEDKMLVTCSLKGQKI